MLFTNQKHQPYTNINLQLSDSNIQRIMCTKLLELYIDEKIKMG